jgi:hypothetical protein
MGVAGPCIPQQRLRCRDVPGGGVRTAFAVVPVRHELARADFDDLAQQTGTHQRRPPDLRAETQPPPVIDLTDHQVRRRPILGGLISEYQIAA